MIRGWYLASCCAVAFIAFPAVAQEQPRRPTLEQLERIILDREPTIRVEHVDQERIVVRRIEVVDEDGVIRMVIAAPAPAPILDGLQYRRAFDVAGITLYDDQGSERGGLGYAQVPGGAVAFALDHNNADAVGFRVMPDGSVMFLMNQRPAQVREPGLGDRLIPGVASASRVRMNVSATGHPSIELADASNRPRVRITLTEEERGALEFLDGDGQVVHRLVPEGAN